MNNNNDIQQQSQTDDIQQQSQVEEVMAYQVGYKNITFYGNRRSTQEIPKMKQFLQSNMFESSVIYNICGNVNMSSKHQ